MMPRILLTLSAFATCLTLSVAAPAARGQIDAPTDEAEQTKANDKPVIKHKPAETMMFSIDEYNQIQGRLAGGGGGGQKFDTGIEKADLYLSTILYNGPKDWTIWVNGTPISPKDEFQSIQVTAIAPSYVELLIPLSAQGMRPVRLGPNQTFVAKTGSVVEGRLH